MTRHATFLRPVPVAATVLAAASGAWLAWAPIAGAETQPGEVADLVERASPAVVTVLATQDRTDQAMPEQFAFGPNSPFEEFFRRFGMPEGMPSPNGPQQHQQGMALGSGFVMEPDGYIVTNDHVVDEATKVKVRFSDDREFDAKVVGTDQQTDLAVLKIDAEDLPYLPLGNSDAIRVGEDVIAVGNPFGLGGTVTRGIVSAVSRDINAGPYVDFIQTDAAINRGNSGGPLLNLQGEVIGVNSAIYSPNGGSVGVGFAIPSNTVKQVVMQLKDGGSVERGWLGVSIQTVTPDIAAAVGLDEPKGALVAEVVEDSPAQGKLKTGDVIVSFDGKQVDSSRDLPKLVAAAAPDHDATVGILRDGKAETITLKLGRLDAEKMASLDPSQSHQGSTASEQLGATLSALTPAAREQLRLSDDMDGVVITSLDGSGLAAEAGLEVGDVILQVGNNEVHTPADVDQALKDQKHDAILFQIARNGARLFVGVRLG
ncbi:DegQ family serine endoprotease [Rhodobacteraceae bacterium DSL-40]|uniref:DegQ family serine endoprotease n=1 Tax=Amaricoccus sp. B4 TaxID=3368557 RepID=UPI000DACF92A